MTRIIVLALLICPAPGCQHSPCERPAPRLSERIVIPPPDPRDLPTAEDLDVLAVALGDFAADRRHPWSAERDSRGAERGGGAVVVHSSSSVTNGWLSDDQIEGDLRDSRVRLSPHLIASLRARNAAPAPLSALAGRDPAVVIDDLSETDRARRPWERLETFRRRHPGARAFAHAWLPGYSADATEAAVRFGFGPTVHGASATYLLRRESGGWR